MPISTKRLAACLFATISLTLLATTAHADEPTAKDAPASGEAWYGWEYAAADVSGMTLLLYERTNSSGPLVNDPLLPDQHGRHLSFVAPMSDAGVLGAGLYLGGAPLTHLANGQPLNAFASLAARSMPLLLVQIAQPIGGFTGFFVRDSHGQRASCDDRGSSSFCIDLAAGSHANDGLSAGADIGLFGGAAMAILVDEVALSRNDIGRHEKKRAVAGDLAPNVFVGKGSAYAGVGGRF